jgi:hypothetical protein
MLKELKDGWYQGEFLVFRNAGKVKKDALTDLVEVYSHTTHILLGHIKFWGHWRKYVFFPLTGMLFDSKCLRELAEAVDMFTANQIAERKARQKGAK